MKGGRDGWWEGGRGEMLGGREEGKDGGCREGFGEGGREGGEGREEGEEWEGEGRRGVGYSSALCHKFIVVDTCAGR